MGEIDVTETAKSLKHNQEKKQKINKIESHGWRGISIQIATIYYLKYLFFQKYYKVCKQQESMTHKQEIKQAIQIAIREVQMSDLADRFQSSYHRYVQRTRGSYDLKTKVSYDDNVSPSRKYQQRQSLFFKRTKWTFCG